MPGGGDPAADLCGKEAQRQGRGRAGNGRLIPGELMSETQLKARGPREVSPDDLLVPMADEGMEGRGRDKAGQPGEAASARIPPRLPPPVPAGGRDGSGTVGPGAPKSSATR